MPLNRFHRVAGVLVVLAGIVCGTSGVAQDLRPRGFSLSQLSAGAAFVFVGRIKDLATERPDGVDPALLVATVEIEQVIKVPRDPVNDTTPLGTAADFEGASITLVGPDEALPATEARSLFFVNPQRTDASGYIFRVVEFIPAGSDDQTARSFVAAEGVTTESVISEVNRLQKFEGLTRLLRRLDYSDDRPFAALGQRGAPHLPASDETRKEAVVHGTVRISDNPRLQPRQQISEHDPQYVELEVQVDVPVTKDIDPGESLRVLYPASRDVAWREFEKIVTESQGADAAASAVSFARSNAEEIRQEAFVRLTRREISEAAHDGQRQDVYIIERPYDIQWLSEEDTQEAWELVNDIYYAPETLINEPVQTRDGLPFEDQPRLQRSDTDAGRTRASLAIESTERDVVLVNMVPAAQSGEQSQDSEPFLAVHPGLKLLVGSAFTPNPIPDGTSPLYVSKDGGFNWELNFNVQAQRIVDQTFSFPAKKSDAPPKLYGSIIKTPGFSIPVLESENPELAAMMRELEAGTITTPNGDSNRLASDQPFIQSRTFATGNRIYVGENFLERRTGRTASLRVSLDGGKSWRLFGLESRTTAGQDAPSVRPAVADDGTVYGAFIRWKQRIGKTFIGDIVVCRSDTPSMSNNFNALAGADGLPGKQVVIDRRFDFDSRLGAERVGSSLSLTVHPRNSSVIAVAWADHQSQNGRQVYTSHVRWSRDRGRTWSEDLWTVPGSTVPAVAMADNGVLGFLCQELRGDRWITRLRRIRENGTELPELVLSTLTEAAARVEFLPYLGDYCHMIALDNHFYGIFSTSNQLAGPTPASDGFLADANFPQGVRFQRRLNGAKLVSRSGRDVVNSIDPYFFRIATGEAAVSEPDDSGMPDPGATDPPVTDPGSPEPGATYPGTPAPVDPPQPGSDGQKGISREQLRTLRDGLQKLMDQFDELLRQSSTVATESDSEPIVEDLPGPAGAGHPVQPSEELPKSPPTVGVFPDERQLDRILKELQKIRDRLSSEAPSQPMKLEP